MISTTDFESPGSMANTPNGDGLGSGGGGVGGNTKTPHPCDACKRSKLKCDQRRPTCETCQKRRKTCNYSAADEYTDGRVRKFHRRSRNGCSHCKARRVRCDETKPVCGGCRRKDVPDLCIYPPDHGRSSHSKSPTPRSTSPPPRPAPAPITATGHSLPDAGNTGNTGNAGIANSTQIQATGVTIPMTDYFAHQSPLQVQQAEPLVGHQTINPSDPNSNNALSIWNPSYNAPSPNTLLASLFGPQPIAVDSFPSASIFNMDPSLTQYDPSYDFTTNVSKLDNSSISDMDHQQFFKVPACWERTTNAVDEMTTSRQDDIVGFPPHPHPPPLPLALDNMGNDSSESTPISLNGNTAYNSNLASFVQPEYRNRPEHPAYLYQLQMLENPDQLAPYFPSLEQRHQYRHFFQETSKSLLVVPTPQASNPFLRHFSHLALGAPAGQSLCHDAFRSALLSLASLDIGIKMSMAMPGMNQNAMYATSDEQRSEAHKRLIAASISGMFVEDSADAELAIATTVALSIRDRLAGCQEWEPPLKIGRDVVVDAGGPAAFISARPTSDRRFLVEQMAVLELIGYLTIWVSPKLFGWENEWFYYYDTDEGPDHLETVYGWTREAVVYAARTMKLCGEARDIEAMRDAQPKPGYRRLKEIIDTRAISLIKRVREFLPQGDVVKTNTMMRLSPPEVTVGVLGVQACMDLCLRTVILMEDIKASQVQNLVKTILDISDDSISRGRYAGLLLPLSWADGVAYDPVLKKRAKMSLNSLRRHYHLNQELLDRIIRIDWATLNNIGLGEWEAFLRQHGYYVPCF